MPELKTITVELVFSYLIILCRIGSALMVLPGISESYIAARSRLILALSITLVILPNIVTPKIPTNIVNLGFLIIIEIIIGIFLGSITKFLISAMHVLGMLIATISGLGSALLFDPTQGTQGALVGTFLSNLSIMLFFATDMHHMLIYGFADSYSLFELGQTIDIGEISQEMTSVFNKSFNIAIRLAAPQIIVAVIIVLAGGVLGRLMPALQIFNLIAPVQMIISFIILMFTISTFMLWYIDNVYEINQNYFIP
ncbi:MAG: flagellar biosynthetic protein FliR [Alphaproteobacteria bacterium]